MTDVKLNSFWRWLSGETKPSSQRVRVPSLPPGVPDNAREAYSQARFLVERSPKASGALSRYCIQQIVRDFWKLSADRAVTVASDLDQISDLVSAETRASINCVRQFGSIESQLSQDRDLMVETTAGEAKILIAMLHLLVQEWYGERHNRQCRLEAIRSMVKQATEANIALSVEKETQTSANTSCGNGSEPVSPTSPESKKVLHVKSPGKKPPGEIDSKDA